MIEICCMIGTVSWQIHISIMHTLSSPRMCHLLLTRRSPMQEKSIKLEETIFLNLQRRDNLIGLDKEQQALSCNLFFFSFPFPRDDKIIMEKQSQLNYKCIHCLVNILSHWKFGGIDSWGPFYSRLWMLTGEGAFPLMSPIWVTVCQQKVTGRDRDGSPLPPTLPQLVYDSRPCVSCLEIQVKTY